MKKTYFSVYRVKNLVMIPAQFSCQAGYLEMDPVAVHDLADEQGIVASIVAELNQDRGNASTPVGAYYPQPVVLAPAGLKSWSALEKKGKGWWGQLRANGWEIRASRTNEKGKWEPDPLVEKMLPGDAALEKIAQIVVESVKSAEMPV